MISSCVLFIILNYIHIDQTISHAEYFQYVENEKRKVPEVYTELSDSITSDETEYVGQESQSAFCNSFLNRLTWNN